MSYAARRAAGLFVACGLLLLACAPSGGAAPAATAAPAFPALSGRVVDAAQLLPTGTEQQLTADLARLETSTGRQLVVATVSSLGGYEVEEYGYRLGRAWGIGDAKADNGAILLVAPNERAVRIEVGYGLEPVLTDTVSSAVIQGQIVPRFKAGDMPGGIVAGTNALIGLLSAPEGEAEALATAAPARTVAASEEDGLPMFAIILVIFFVLWLMTRGGRGRGRRRRGGGLADVLIWSAINSAGRGGGGWGGGSFGGGGFSGGGFGGGGGSFGGGGASGRW